MRFARAASTFAISLPLLGWPAQAAVADGDAAERSALSRYPGAAEYRDQQERHERRFALVEVSRPELRSRLLELQKADQEAWTSTSERDIAERSEFGRATRERTRELKRIVAASGFPSPRQVDLDGFKAAWLLAQHADHDLAFQQRSLGMVLRLARRHREVRPYAAMLDDRISVAKGRPQRYGTQFMRTEAGALSPMPVEDPRRVDALRKAMGLMPLSDYACLLNAIN